MECFAHPFALVEDLHLYSLSKNVTINLTWFFIKCKEKRPFFFSNLLKNYEAFK